MAAKVSAFGHLFSCLRVSPYLVDNTVKMKRSSRTLF